MPWELIRIQKNVVRRCPYCNQTEVTAPPLTASGEQQIAHYKEHGYIAPTPEQLAELENGSVQELVLEHP